MSKKPNILLLFTDMQRADTIGALGNPCIRTPALDRLCREGAAFDRAYTPCPVCVPARACLHYGVYPHRTGLYQNGRMPEDDGTSYVQRLGEAGYRTHVVGKCHFTPDCWAMRGFQSRDTQEEISDLEGDDYLKDLFAAGYDHLTDPHGVRGEMYYIPQPAQMSARLHPTQWIGDRALTFIDQQQQDNRPWYLTASFVHPHPPLTPPVPWHKLYRIFDVPMPNVPVDHESHWTHVNRIQNRYKYRDRGVDYQLLRMIRAYYYACISFVDYQVGRIIDRLEQLGQLDNTLIAFASDHGEYLGDYLCFGKRAMHDPSSRIPMIVRWPEVFDRGVRCGRPVSLIDLASTFCEAGGAGTEGFDGLSLADSGKLADRPYVFSQHGTAGAAQYMIVSDQMKYFYSAADDQEYLYDLRCDPHETRRLPCRQPDPRQAERQALRDALLAYLERMGHDAAYEKTEDGRLEWRRYDPPPPMPVNPDDGLIFQDHPWAEEHIRGYSRT